MRARRFLVGAAAAALVVGLSSGPATTPSTSPATRAVVLAADTPPPAPGARRSVTPEDAPDIASPAALMMPLQEFRTSRNSGWFYTLSPAEAAAAVHKLKFMPQGPVGAMYLKPVSGATAVHRLRIRAGAPSYLLSISAAETSDPRFADEGVVGYVASSPRPGLVRLMRFRNHSQWRVAVESLANVHRAAGYTEDGTLGWVRP